MGDPPPDHRPSRAVFLLAFSAVVLAGLFGAAIGAGLADVGCERSCGGTVAFGGILGGAVGAGGVAVVAVLVLRAMAEWDRIRARDEGEGGGQEGAPPG